MSVRVLYDRQRELAALYCSTDEIAFGPLFDDRDGHDGEARAEAFLSWLLETETWPSYERHFPLGGSRDARQLTAGGLAAAYLDWLKHEPAQWARQHAD